MHATRLKEKRDIAEGTMEFTFARPDGFGYRAGQTIDLRLIYPPETDAEGNFRTFSLVSAPHEPVLKIATRIRDSAYKRVLAAMPEGTPLSFEGPFGSFFLHENAARPAIFLSGGIGITPFRSILSDAAERALPHRIALLYANRRPEDAAFLDELEAFAAKHPNFTLIPTMTGMETSREPWGGARGHIDASMLARHVPAGTSPVYYLAGPSAMVMAMRSMLIGNGVSGDDIRFEEFAGY